MPICGMIVESLYKNHNVKIYATKCKNNFDRKIFASFGINIIELKNYFEIINFYNKIIANDLFILTGWNFFNLIFISFLKIKSNLKIYCTVDNIYSGSFKQLFAIHLKIGFIFDLFFDGYFVPGRLSYKYLKSIGVKKPIFFRSYGASTKVFNKKSNILERNNEFLYIGSLSKRKATKLLIDAYLKYKLNGGTWGLTLVGDCLDDNFDFNGVKKLPFSQPYNLNLIMNESKCFILPSYLDHWGTVLCEASAAGMVLLGSKYAGSSHDLIINGLNGYIFAPEISEIENMMFKIEKSNDEWLINASDFSLKSASKFNEYTYAKSVKRMG